MNRPVAAVVVAYGAPENLTSCLESLADTVPIVVVDNSGNPSTAKIAESAGATYVDAGANIGFGAAVNVALKALRNGASHDILLVNPDAFVSTSAVHALISCLDAHGHERVAAASPKLVGEDGAPERVVWPFPSPWRAWIDALGLGRRLPARHSFVVGAVLLLRGQAIEDVGPFDERFFLYSEETDWQRRALRAGWTSMLCTGATATHVGAGSSTDPRRREALFHAGQETYVRKWHGRFGWLVYRAAVITGAGVRALLLPGDRRREAARRVALYARGPRRCAGLTDAGANG